MCKAEIEKLADNTFAAIDEFVYTKPTKLPGTSPTPEQCAKAVWLARSGLSKIPKTSILVSILSALESELVSADCKGHKSLT